VTTYRVAPGFHLTDEDAKILGPAWEALEKKLGRSPTVADLVAEARKPKSAFHPYFEWDPEKQIELYLETRARYLIRSLDVIIPEKGDQPVRGIIPMGDGEFMSTVKAVRDRPDVIALQVDRARADAKVMFERYQGWIAFEAFEPAVDWVESARRLAYEG
jgi:hypothetical protein